MTSASCLALLYERAGDVLEGVRTLLSFKSPGVFGVLKRVNPIDAPLRELILEESFASLMRIDCDLMVSFLCSSKLSVEDVMDALNREQALAGDPPEEQLRTGGSVVDQRDVVVGTVGGDHMSGSSDRPGPPSGRSRTRVSSNFTGGGQEISYGGSSSPQSGAPVLDPVALRHMPGYWTHLYLKAMSRLDPSIRQRYSNQQLLSFADYESTELLQFLKQVAGWFLMREESS